MMISELLQVHMVKKYLDKKNRVAKLLDDIEEYNAYINMLEQEREVREMHEEINRAIDGYL